MSVEDAEIKRTLNQAALVWRDRYAPPLLPGVAARALQWLRSCRRKNLSEAHALKVLLQEQRWALHRRAMLKVCALTFISALGGLIFSLIIEPIKRGAPVFAFLFGLSSLLLVLSSPILFLISVAYLLSPLPFNKIEIRPLGTEKLPKHFFVLNEVDFTRTAWKMICFCILYYVFIFGFLFGAIYLVYTFIKPLGNLG